MSKNGKRELIDVVLWCIVGFISTLIIMNVFVDKLDIHDVASIVGSMIGSIIAIGGTILGINYQFNKQARLQEQRLLNTQKAKLLSNLVKSKVISERIDIRFFSLKAKLQIAIMSEEEKRRLFVNQLNQILGETYIGTNSNNLEVLNQEIFKLLEDLIIYKKCLTDKESDTLKKLIDEYREYVDHFGYLVLNSKQVILEGGNVVVGRVKKERQMTIYKTIDLLDMSNNIVDEFIKRFNNLFDFLEQIQKSE